MKSLQNRIFILFVMLLLLVQAIALWTLYSGNKLQETQAINTRLTTAKTIFSEIFQRRLDYLAAFSETVAKDFGIKQVFDDDTRSLLVALNNHRKRINADLAMAISANNKITAQLMVEYHNNKQVKVMQGPERGELFRYPAWLASQQQAYLYQINDNLYQVSFSPLTVGTKTIGWLAFGFQIDQRLALEFRNITGLETDFLLKKNQHWQLVVSSNKQASVPFATQIINGKTPTHYIATSQLMTEFELHQLGVVMYGLRANFVELLRSKWLNFLLLATITLLVSLASAYWIAASITKPIKRLVNQAKNIASGNYDQPVQLNDRSELGQLAHEFNTMQQAVLSREQAIMHRANHDPLTDLPNRNVLKLSIKQLLTNQQPFTLLHLNISRLKDVNDTLGHDVGDQVIKEVGHRLTQCQSLPMLYHLGTDEFILISTQTSSDGISQSINGIQQQLEQNFDYQGLSFQLQVRIGVACYPRHSQSAEALLQMADTALHHTRKSRQSVQMYHSDFDINSIERLSLINDLKQAIPAGQLELHYQPKLNLTSQVITHVEALVRWRHPQLGMIAPDDFIHIAEQTGQINALTQWVIITALQQYHRWQEQQIELNIAINITAENLKADDFYDFVCKTLTEYKVPPNHITLEVTESAVVEDPEQAVALLSRFTAQGIHISIDDYGTGYSSLAQLKQLPVHELKIDKSFVQRLQQDEDDQIIVRSTIELAHNMGLYVVAEGIEDEYSLHWLTQHGCELGQGYFISKPKPPEELTIWLLESKQYAVHKVTT